MGREASWKGAKPRKINRIPHRRIKKKKGTPKENGSRKSDYGIILS